jgi:hypothetical protein
MLTVAATHHIREYERTDVISKPFRDPRHLLQYKYLGDGIHQKNRSSRQEEEKGRPDSLPTPIWFPTEYIESRFERARSAR